MSATETSIRRRAASALAGCLVLVLAGACATTDEIAFVRDHGADDVTLAPIMANPGTATQ